MAWSKLFLPLTLPGTAEQLNPAAAPLAPPLSNVHRLPSHTALAASVGAGAGSPSLSASSVTASAGSDDDKGVRKKSPWKSDSKKKKSGEKKQRTVPALLDTIFSSSKRRQSNVAPPAAPLTVTRTARAAPSSAALARGVAILQSIFPSWEPETLQVVLEANEFIMEEAISAILGMEAVEKASGSATDEDTEAPGYSVKNPLPEDFLRVRTVVLCIALFGYGDCVTHCVAFLVASG